MAGAMGNPLMAIGDAVPARIVEAREERDRAIARVLELNHEIARLETALQVTGAAAVQAQEDKKTAPELAETDGPRRRSRETPVAPGAG